MGDEDKDHCATIEREKLIENELQGQFSLLRKNN